MTDELLTPDEAAARLKVPPRNILNALRSGDLVGVKIGKFWRIRLEDLERFLDERQNVKPKHRTRG